MSSSPPSLELNHWLLLVWYSSMMRAKRCSTLVFWSAFFLFWAAGTALLSPKGVNFEVQALMGIKASLMDPHSVLENWDQDSVDPCSWTMVTCSPENLVVGLATPSQNLSGTLSPTIGNLTNLKILFLQNNNMSGPIPPEIGKLSKLQTIDLSNNYFSGEIPDSLGNLNNLQYMRLNNNSLSGAFPESLVDLPQLAFLDLSYNNLSGTIPKIPARTFNIVGNPLLCPSASEQKCYGMMPMPMSFKINSSQNAPTLMRSKSHKLILVFGSTFGSICLLSLGFGLLLWWKQMHDQHIFFDVNDQHHEEVSLGNLKRFQFRELQIATNNFSSKNILGHGGFGNVYRGQLQDGTLVAIKRLKDGNAAGGEMQFKTEVEMISLAVHRNLLRLLGFCTTATERLLIYPYMSNGSVASRLKAKPTLDWKFGKAANQKGAILDWVRKIHQERSLDVLVDRDLKNNYDRVEVEEIIQVVILCTQYLPGHRPKMSEVVRMLEGDGLAERWEASRRIEAHKLKVPEIFSEQYSDITDDSSLLIEAIELSGPR
ncbi:hypothetical protein OPV22_025008 [Ensete ventricosum]|uniref:Protein kinase domain-containing protein n=1 Tax=Ensete ventricosum TaxID=4639 RepID=A0AAV8Q8Q3_ENSVE|nr:hypothetical protein OPV22_025008 [Ensete ventricosum]